jgi:hypothetical protein
MSFRERMTGTESAADVAIRTPLKKALLKRLIINKCPFPPLLEFQKTIILEATNVDVLINRMFEHKESIVALLDGPVHLESNAVKLRDEYVTNTLERKGYIVKRYPYVPPLSQKKIEEIVASIVDVAYPATSNSE